MAKGRAAAAAKREKKKVVTNWQPKKKQVSHQVLTAEEVVEKDEIESADDDSDISRDELISHIEKASNINTRVGMEEDANVLKEKAAEAGFKMEVIPDTGAGRSVISQPAAEVSQLEKTGITTKLIGIGNPLNGDVYKSVPVTLKDRSAYITFTGIEGFRALPLIGLPDFKRMNLLVDAVRGRVRDADGTLIASTLELSEKILEKDIKIDSTPDERVLLITKKT